MAAFGIASREEVQSTSLGSLRPFSVRNDLPHWLANRRIMGDPGPRRNTRVPEGFRSTVTPRRRAVARRQSANAGISSYG